MPVTTVAAAAQRNHHRAPRELVEGVVAGGGLHLGERRHLHEVEVVEQADPHDPDDHVRPSGRERATAPADDVQGICDDDHAHNPHVH